MVLFLVERRIKRRTKLKDKEIKKVFLNQELRRK